MALRRRSAPGPSTVVSPSYSRRKTLTFLGVSVASAMVAVSCGGGSSDDSSGAQPKSGKPMNLPLKTLKFKTIQVDGQGKITAENSAKAPYFDEPSLGRKVGNALPLRMVKIPTGEFMMGSPATETSREDVEGPQHLVTVPSFFIGAFVITQKQYEAIMGDNPSHFTDDGDDFPVEQVSWLEADAFCKQLSEMTGRTYRLPSEAEWEYACRAGTTTPFCFGETLTTEIANYFADFNYIDDPEENYRNNPKAVDSFWPNAFGLYNTHGNVYEWCADDFHESYKTSSADATIKVSGSEAISKVLRGGSWFDDPRYCRAAYRDKNSQTGRSNAFGFRVVCET